MLANDNIFVIIINLHNSISQNISSLKSIFWYNKQVMGHHVESLGELRKASTEVHLIFKLHENIFMMKISMSKQPVEPSHYLKQMFSAACRD